MSDMGRLLFLCFVAFLLLLRPLPGASAAPLLSPDARISLLTGTPGEELYSTFGHSAVRVYDPARNTDLVFNYGTFDFDTPNFYLKFLRGKLDYMLSVSEYERFKVGYYYSGQSVTEQVLNLDSGSTQRVFNFLIDNYKPHNRYYKYDFFYDNCATRIRDLVRDLAADSVVFDYPDGWIHAPNSFRTLLDHHLVSDPWSDFGIDIVLGLPADRLADPSQYMFLPEFMRIAFAHGRVWRRQQWQPLVQSTELIIENKTQAAAGFRFGPLHANWILFAVLLLITAIGYRTGRRMKAVDYILFGTLGAVGWLIVVLWFFTDHIATKDNLNILWALPWHLPMIFFVLRRRHRLHARYYFVITATTAFLLLILWPVNPQMFHIAVVPVLLTIIVRSLPYAVPEQPKT
jgi:hypothetical protein